MGGGGGEGNVFITIVCKYFKRKRSGKLAEYNLAQINCVLLRISYHNVLIIVSHLRLKNCLPPTSEELSPTHVWIIVSPLYVRNFVPSTSEKLSSTSIWRIIYPRVLMMDDVKQQFSYNCNSTWHTEPNCRTQIQDRH